MSTDADLWDKITRLEAEIERLRSLLRRYQVAWPEDDSNLAAETRAALEGK